MAELFRLRIASGQMSIPPRLVSRLQLQEGDEFEIEIQDDNNLTLDVKKQTAGYTPSTEELAEFDRREQRLLSADQFDTLLKSIESRTAPSAKAKTKTSSAS